jgi:cobalt-zinc-cadmium efflux system membrane fusion protein
MKHSNWIWVALVVALAGCEKDEEALNRRAAGESHRAAEVRDHAAGEKGDAREARHLVLTPEQIKNAQIEVAAAGPATIRERLTLYGVVTPNAEQVRDVTARFPGVIRGVRKRVGDSIQQGETLATVESNESLQTYAVISPLTGVITARAANTGEQAADKPLFTVADLSSVWVELSLFPRDVAKVRVGQTVRVKSTDAQLSGEGKVVYVAPFGTTSNQTLNARVLLDNATRKWPPGLYVSAEVTLGTQSVPLAISSSALQTIEQDNVVFVKGEEGFEPRPVRVGKSDGDVTEVTAGLAPGESYATRNSFILKAELAKGEAEHGH